MALHNTETPTLPKIASTDIVLASTLLLTLGPKKGKTNLIGLLMRVHFHRLIVDEAHDNELGQGNKKALSVLSATHRLSVTGAPLGSRLSDLYGQVRFLRVAPFDRPAFWSELIEEPYAAKDAATLGVLRLLLSHIVVRHSKEQTHDDGRCLVALPPRRIEQILLDFGSDEEQQLYALIESRNRTYWTEIAAAEKDAAFHSKYLECKKLLLDARRACAHASIVDFSAMQHWRERAKKKVERARYAEGATTARTMAGEMNRKDVFGLAMKWTNDDPIRMARMRKVVYDFQSGADDECPICFEVGHR